MNKGLNNLVSYRKILKRTKYLLLKNPNNLTKKDKARLDETPRKGFKVEQHLDTVQAYGLVLEFKKAVDKKIKNVPSICKNILAGVEKIKGKLGDVSPRSNIIYAMNSNVIIPMAKTTNFCEICPTPQICGL